MSKLLSMQDNLLRASAAELLRTDTLRLTTKELHEHTVYLPDTHVLVHYRTGSPPTRLHTYWRGPMKVGRPGPLLSESLGRVTKRITHKFYKNSFYGYR